MLLHYLGKLKTQIFCQYSADVEENANNLHLSPLTLLFIHNFFDIFGVYNTAVPNIRFEFEPDRIVGQIRIRPNTATIWNPNTDS